jgi:hypothetical protein
MAGSGGDPVPNELIDYWMPAFAGMTTEDRSAVIGLLGDLSNT